MEWRENAKCKGLDARLFYPERGGPYKEAKMICSTCDVQAECLDDALANVEKHGVWGGKSERERRKFRSLNGEDRS